MSIEYDEKWRQKVELRRNESYYPIGSIEDIIDDNKAKINFDAFKQSHYNGVYNLSDLRLPSSIQQLVEIDPYLKKQVERKDFIGDIHCGWFHDYEIIIEIDHEYNQIVTKNFYNRVSQYDFSSVRPPSTEPYLNSNYFFEDKNVPSSLFQHSFDCLDQFKMSIHAAKIQIFKGSQTIKIFTFTPSTKKKYEALKFSYFEYLFKLAKINNEIQNVEIDREIDGMMAKKFKSFGQEIAGKQNEHYGEISINKELLESSVIDQFIEVLSNNKTLNLELEVDLNKNPFQFLRSMMKESGISRLKLKINSEDIEQVHLTLIGSKDRVTSARDWIHLQSTIQTNLRKMEEKLETLRSRKDNGSMTYHDSKHSLSSDDISVTEDEGFLSYITLTLSDNDE